MHGIVSLCCRFLSVLRRAGLDLVLGLALMGLFVPEAAAQEDIEQEAPIEEKTASEDETGLESALKVAPDDPTPNDGAADHGATDDDATDDDATDDDATDEGDDSHVEDSMAPAEKEEIDDTGTPPSPPREQDELPRGKWDPNYDGRRKKRRAEDAIIWVPRAPLLPVHLVLNYGVRFPIVSVISEAEEARLPKRLESFFRFADGKAGLFPIALYDRGRGFAAGAHFFYRDLGREGHSLRATVAYGTNRWEFASVRDAWTVFDGQTGEVGFTARYERSPNHAYAGLGPLTDIEDQAFFTRQEIQVGTDLQVALVDLSRFSTSVTYKRFRLLDRGREPELRDSEFTLDDGPLTGFGEWWDLMGLGLNFDLDTRRPEREFSTGSGVRVENWGTYNFSVASPAVSFFRYGSRPGVFWDITGHNHVVSASVYAEALSNVVGQAPPVSELIELGGDDMLRGFLRGRFRGESALAYNINYSWPVLAYADVVLFGDVGNTFRGFFEDLAHDKMSVSWGGGVRTSFSRELVVQLLLAWGTNQIENWDQDFSVDNFRFVAGVTRGF